MYVEVTFPAHRLHLNLKGFSLTPNKLTKIQKENVRFPLQPNLIVAFESSN